MSRENRYVVVSDSGAIAHNLISVWKLWLSPPARLIHTFCLWLTNLKVSHVEHAVFDDRNAPLVSMIT